MYYAEYNSNEEDEISKKLKKEFETNKLNNYAEMNDNKLHNNNYNYNNNYAEYNNLNEDEILTKSKQNYVNNSKNITNNNNIHPVYDNYYKPQTGFCDMSFGGLIQNNSTSTIVIPVNADLNYDIDCKMGYTTTLLIPITIPTVTENSPVIIIPIVTQQNIDKNNNNIITTATQQPILEAKLENSKIYVKAIDNIANIHKNSQIVSSVTNLNESLNKVEATTVTSLPIKPNENKRVTTESNIINTDISGSNTKTNTNISISQACLNGSLQCDVNQLISNIKSDISHNYNTYSESSRTIIDLSSGEISLFKKNITKNISTTPTTFINKEIDISNNSDISKNIVLVNDDKSLKMTIPTQTPTNVKVDISGQVMSTTSDAIKITTKNPYTISTINDRFSVDKINGYAVTPYNENNNEENFPTIRNPVITNY
jgi:hypothetical protein